MSGRIQKKVQVHERREEFVEKMGFKGELNVDKKWQSDYLFYIIMNEIHPHVDQF